MEAGLVPFAFYTFITLIPDHFDPRYNQLRAREVTFCVRTIREKVHGPMCLFTVLVFRN